MKTRHLMALLAATMLAGSIACQSQYEETTGTAPAHEAAAPQATPSTAPAPQAAPTPAADKVAVAVTIAKAIEADPDAADTILADHGMTQGQFEDLLFEIAADPELSRRYASEMER